MKYLKMRAYIDEQPEWPDHERVILASYDSQSVVVYLAVNRRAGSDAAALGRLDGSGISLDRMLWVQTSFFWTMHSSEWATARGQDCVLAIWLPRTAFDSLLAASVHSHFEPDVYTSKADWQTRLDTSDVRVQWAPDFAAIGPKLKRKTIQLGLGGETLREFATTMPIHIEDITQVVQQQAEFVDMPDLMFSPIHRVYPVSDPDTARHLLLDKSMPDKRR